MMSALKQGRRLLIPTQHRAAAAALPSSWLSTRQNSGQQAGSSGQGAESDPPPESPSAAATVGLMGLGAVGAVAIAAVGVYGVLQMALLVARGTGRSIMADREKQNLERAARADSAAKPE